MPIVNSAQPDFIQINSNLRLRAYDGHYQVAFSWYQDPELVYFVDGKKRKLFTRKDQEDV